MIVCKGAYFIDSKIKMCLTLITREPKKLFGEKYWIFFKPKYLGGKQLVWSKPEACGIV
jgi:hypothetical protein